MLVLLYNIIEQNNIYKSNASDCNWLFEGRAINHEYLHYTSESKDR